MFRIRTLAEEMDEALLRERLLAMLSTVFGVLAALLAGIGIYGVVAYSVGRRTQEIGGRIPLDVFGHRLIAYCEREMEDIGQLSDAPPK